MQKLCKNNKSKKSAPMWNHKFEIPDGLYSVSYIQGYSEHIIKKHVAMTNNSPIRISENKI